MSKWYEDVERQQDVYVYSRIRLARNIKGRVFPNKTVSYTHLRAHETF